jgi:ureidoacrylate peracid hydrolase
MWWNHIKEINPKETVVLVINMQNDFVMEGGSMYTEMGNQILPSMAEFLDKCRNKGIMIIYTIWENNTIWGEIHKTILPKTNEKVIKKIGYSAFKSPELDLILKHNNIKIVTIIGVMTDCCCLATAFDANFLEYKIAFIADLTGTKPYPDLGFGPGNTEIQQKTTLGGIAYSIGHVLNSDDYFKLIK